MTSRTICFALALLATAAISSQASERVEQQNMTQAQAPVPPQPKRQAQAPQRRSVARPEQAARPSGGSFDGIWAVASSLGCDEARVSNSFLPREARKRLCINANIL